MIFLNPSVLFGLLAASIPVLIHFLNLRKIKKVEFSSLAFLKEIENTKIRRVKFKQWLLLLLRILIILFLVFAIARPTIKSVSLAGAGSSVQTTAVFILDDSYSMSAVSSKGSFFNQSKSIIKNLQKEFNQNDDVNILTTSKIEEKFGFAELDQMGISDIKGNFWKALDEAFGIFRESQNFNKELYILSDNQFSLKDSDSLNISGIENLKVYSFNLFEEVGSNLTIENLELENQILERGKPIEFKAEIKNNSISEQAESVVSLYINGKRKAQNRVELDPKQRQTFKFETILESTGLHEVVLEIDDDEILQDNKFYTVFNVPKEISVLIFADNPDEINFLELALGKNSGVTNINYEIRPTSYLQSINLNKYDAVVSVVLKNIDNSQLMNFVKNGGGLFLIPSENVKLEDFRRFCKNFGFVIESKINLNRTDSPLEFDEFNLEHPIFRNLFAESENVKVNSPDIINCFEVKKSVSTTSIIDLINGSEYLAENKIEKGKTVLLSGSANLKSSDFPLKGLFAPLMNKIIYYVSNSNNNTESYKTGDEIYFSMENAGTGRLKVVEPDNSENFLGETTLKNNLIKYKNTENPGIYYLKRNDKIIDFTSVNIDPDESKKFENTTKELKSKFKSYEKVNFYELEPDGSYIKLLKEARFGSELWRYFIIAALITALFEMLIAKSSKKDLIDISN